MWAARPTIINLGEPPDQSLLYNPEDYISKLSYCYLDIRLVR